MKLASGPAGRAALATYGIRGEPLASVAWAALGAIEAGLAVCLAAGAEGAAWATAALFTVFCAAQGVALLQGRGGRAVRVLRRQGPDRPRVGRPRRAAGRRRRDAAAARPPRADHRGVARRSGSPPRCSASPRSALGRARARARDRRAAARDRARRARSRSPARGRRSAGAPRSAEHFAGLGDDDFGLAVFTSEGCHICQALAPAVAAFERDPRVMLRRFDERRGRRRVGAGRRARQPVRGRRSAPTGPCSPRARSTPARSSSRVLAAAERRRGAMQCLSGLQPTTRRGRARRGAGSSRAWAAA